MTEGRNPADPGRRVVEASAPCRVDLAGGVLDIWPVYLLHPGAVAVTVAIDRRVSCRVETGVEGIEIESKDALQKLRAGTVAELVAAQGPGLVACVLQALGVESGLRVVTHARVPDGSGLGSSSALALVLTAAIARATGRELRPDEIVSLCRDAEFRTRALPVGLRGYYAGLRGGVLALELGATGVKVERPLVDPARVEESLILVEAGPGRGPGRAEWDVLKGEIDDQGTVRLSLAEIASVARQLLAALVAGRSEDVLALTAREWVLRQGLGSGGTTPAVAGVIEVVSTAGGAGWALDGVVAVWAPPGARGPGRREAVLAALREGGLRPLPVRVDLRGLEVEDVA